MVEYSLALLVLKYPSAPFVIFDVGLAGDADPGLVS